MKKITLCLLALTVLPSCADKVIESPKEMKGAVKKTDAKAALKPGASACPVFNGKYVRSDASTGNLPVVVEIATKQEGEKFSYSINGIPSTPADGSANRIAMDVVTISCDPTMITVVTKENDKVAVTKKYSPEGEKQLKVEVSDKSLNLDGFYTLEVKETPAVTPEAKPEDKPVLPVPAAPEVVVPEVVVPKVDPVVTAPTAACPLLNGKFVAANVSEGNTNIEIIFVTKVEGGKFSYDINETGFFVADGEKRKAVSDEPNAKISLVCDATSVTTDYQADGQEPQTRKYMVVDNKIVVEGTGEAASWNGTYTKL